MNASIPTLNVPKLPLWALVLSGCVVWLIRGTVVEQRILAADTDKLQAEVDYFETKVRPLLVQHCYACHSRESKEIQGGLRVDSRTGLLDGGDSGPAILPGDAQGSLLIAAVKHQALEMPPDRKLDAEAIAVFEQWINRGAHAPTDSSNAPTKPRKGIDWNQARKFWSFSPINASTVPIRSSKQTISSVVSASAPELQLADESFVTWSRNPLDAFVAAKLELAKITPVPESARHTWLRRVYLDLIGLPPNAEEYYAFINDKAPDAYERVVDRLLSSMHYGERWGRHWLDLARYADSNGADENHAYPVAWRYRDYVFAAYNADRPYDQFILEQLAGDLLDAADEKQRADYLTATGFLVLGPKMLAEQDKPKLVADLVDEQLDTFGKVFLGLTLGCARCHDHKFDPITSEDYYSLAGVFHSTKSMAHLEFVSQWNERELPNAEVSRAIAEHQMQLQPAERALKDFELTVRDREFQSQIERLLIAMRECSGSNNPATSGEGVPTERVAEKDREHIDRLKAKLNTKFEEKPATQNKGSEGFDRTGLLRIWLALRETNNDDFPRVAGSLWQQLKDEQEQARLARSAPSNITGQFLSHTPPQTWAELVELYRMELSAAWQSVRAAERDKDGKLRDAKLARTQRELFGKGSWLTYTEKFEDLLSVEEKNLHTPLKERFDSLSKSLPALDRTMAVEDANVKLVALHVRGSHLSQAGKPLPRQVPTLFQFGETAKIQFPENRSGRLELTKWLVRPENPLTARVMANRLWQGHFGDGIVRTSSNFGTKGDPPSNPELLDWLADDFVHGNWSIKRMHRKIVLSATYRLDSISTPEAAGIDPDNRLFWRQNRRRLEVEPFRDALLAVGGVLDSRFSGQAQMIYGDKFEESGAVKTIHDAFRRTVYLPINRAALEDFFSTFDYVDPGVSLEKRPSTTVPHQALFLMNHRLPTHAAWQFSQRLQRSTSDTDQRIRLAFVLALGREPNAAESLSARRYIDQRSVADGGFGSNHQQNLPASELMHDPWFSFCRALLLTSEFIYVD